MKKFVLLVCLFLIPLTLASETQHRFRIHVYVYEEKQGDDPHIRTYLETRLKRAFRLLEDVDIVKADADWHFVFDVCYLQNTFADGRKTGLLSIADGFSEKVPPYYFKTGHSSPYRFPPVYTRHLGVASASRHELNGYCAERVREINKDILTPIRELLR